VRGGRLFRRGPAQGVVLDTGEMYLTCEVPHESLLLLPQIV